MRCCIIGVHKKLSDTTDMYEKGSWIDCRRENNGSSGINILQRAYDAIISSAKHFSSVLFQIKSGSDEPLPPPVRYTTPKAK